MVAIRIYTATAKVRFLYLLPFRGCSSVGRAGPLQGQGRRFESCHLHNIYLHLKNNMLYFCYYD